MLLAIVYIYYLGVFPNIVLSSIHCSANYLIEFIYF